MKRRTLIAQSAAIGAAALAGCGGGSEPDIIVEYDDELLVDGEDIPQEIVDKSSETLDRDPRSIEWFTVTFWVTKGSFDAAQLYEHAKMIVSGDEREPIGVQITQPEQRMLLTSQDSYSMSEGTEGKIFFANQDALPNDHRFVPDDIEGQVGAALRPREE